MRYFNLPQSFFAVKAMLSVNWKTQDGKTGIYLCNWIILKLALGIEWHLISHVYRMQLKKSTQDILCTVKSNAYKYHVYDSRCIGWKCIYLLKLNLF